MWVRVPPPAPFIALPTFAGFGFQLWSYGQEGPPLVWLIVIPSLTVAFGLVVLHLVWKTANSVLKQEVVNEPETEDLSANEIIKLVLSCMGVYFIIDAAIVFPSAFVELQVAINNPANYQIEFPIMHLVTQILEITLGFILIKKPIKILNWLKSVEEK